MVTLSQIAPWSHFEKQTTVDQSTPISADLSPALLTFLGLELTLPYRFLLPLRPQMELSHKYVEMLGLFKAESCGVSLWVCVICPLHKKK